ETKKDASDFSPTSYIIEPGFPLPGRQSISYFNFKQLANDSDVKCSFNPIWSLPFIFPRIFRRRYSKNEVFTNQRKPTFFE
ncbi:MAG: hypothetical protein L0J63_13820, partial [Tetragenococcus koreensis]|nr:hypothetical protein [Tetragenococcus koreensis]